MLMHVRCMHMRIILAVLLFFVLSMHVQDQKVVSTLECECDHIPCKFVCRSGFHDAKFEGFAFKHCDCSALLSVTSLTHTHGTAAELLRACPSSSCHVCGNAAAVMRKGVFTGAANR